MREPRRGEVWWADLASPRGSEPGFPGPVLVVQANAFDASRLRTVIVAAISSRLHLANAPGNLRLLPAESGLPKTSVVNAAQSLTISRDFLRERAGELPARVMNRVADGLRLALAL